MKRSHRWKQQMRQRKRIRVQRRFHVELVSAGDGFGAPMIERHTCRTCGHVELVKHKHIAAQLAAKLAAYRDGSGGIQGTCAACTKKARDERFPLPND